MKMEDGSWNGISIDLWKEIAAELKLEFDFRETELRGLLDGLEQGALDAAVAALGITPEREKRIDFTHPFHVSGLGIAVPSKKESPWSTMIRRLLSLAFLKVAASLCVLLLGVGILAWFFERKKNREQFGGGPIKGIGSGFWWSAVTMTTVGYGDKAPRTTGGRAVAVIWMFTAIIVISTFTAAITSSLTVSQLKSPVQGPEDLPRARAGAVVDTTSAAYLEKNRISFLDYSTSQSGLNALAEGRLDAFVYDAPLLRYLVNQKFKGIVDVLPRTFSREDYGIGLPAGSPLRESINRVLLEIIRHPRWQETLETYFGK
jgi:ABC-type amino acid transport substrate-binding protein